MATPIEVLLGTLADPWPLFGRTDEIRIVADALQRPHAPVFLLGEAGCGKTRLAHEVLQQLAATGRPTARATATLASQDLPLGAFAHLLPSGATDAGLVRSVRDAIDSWGDRGALALHVDDAHLLDVSSATLLVNLVDADLVRPVLTARRGRILPEALTALRSRPEAQTLTIGDLDEREVDELLRTVLGGPVDGVARAQLAHLSRGNPLYLRELVIGGVSDGSLHAVAGVWQLRGSLPTTEALEERVLGRIASLPPEARAALELVALAEPIGVDVLTELAAAEQFEDLEHRGLIAVSQNRRRYDVTLTHPLYGEVLRSTMGIDQLRTHSARLADAVLATGARRSADSGRLVRWQLDAGQAPDPRRALASARVARHHNDWLTANHLARIALDAGLPDAVYLLAESHYALGEFDDGDRVAEPALADPDRLGDVALTGLHRTRAGVWFFGSTQPADAFRAVAEARDRITDPDLRDMLDYARAAMCMWSGRVVEAETLARPLLDAPDPKVRVQAAIAVETVAATAGPATLAIEMADRWYAVHAELADLNGTNSPAFHLLIKTEALVNAGWFDEASGLADFGYQLSVASLNRIAQMWFARQLGRIATYRGDLGAARNWVLEVVALCRGTSWLRPLALGLSDLAVVEAHRGDAAAAAAAIAERDALDVPVVDLFASEGVRGTAWALAAKGDTVEARRILVNGAAAAEAEGIFLLASLARIDALRLGATDQAGPLRQAAATVGSRLVSAAARWADHVDDPAGLLEVAQELEAMGCLRHGAEAAAAAGQAFAAGGDTRRAIDADRLAVELARRATGTDEENLPEPSTALPALTPREAEVARLVADGLSSKAVAEQLHLSPRTVSNHLQNAYGKLGVTGRRELAAVLARLERERAV